MNNIRVYKAIHPDGTCDFMFKENDEGGELAAKSLETIAMSVAAQVSDIHTARFSVASIDFKPFHDVECPEGLTPRRCIPLKPKEQKKFWLHFTEALEEKRFAK